MIKLFYFLQINFAQSQMIQVLLCITNNSIKHQSLVSTSLNNQTVLFQTIQFGKSHLFALSLNLKQFNLIHWSDQGGAGSSGNEGIHCIPQNSIITGASLSDGLRCYPAGAVKYTDCFSAEGMFSPVDDFAGYDLKPSDYRSLTITWFKVLSGWGSKIHRLKLNGNLN